ncbi:hypothetical protein ACMU_13640 [Actibacterium mucosum KCTC 23349]|uniref:Uncharacterized protein n=1 Tax=Actibacterium mucosum KCTC 23349 TaxID=1454373 RepID=A0A037ZJB5_9RHOB|nr:hypothetical protein [Actibacterium mucosum]KAJ55724.1 hypothetical protein ACMU_13640 [Actibacterium mucosum KCTC 23349]
MLDAIFDAYVGAFAIGLPAFAVILLTLGVIRARLSFRPALTLLLGAAAGMGLWYAGAVAAGQAGLLMPPPTVADPPYVLMFLLGGAAVMWAWMWLLPAGRQATQALPLHAIAGYQIPRVMGVLFLIGWLAGEIPWQFAIPAGIGDIWAGIAGYQAYTALKAGAPDARRKLVRANIIGITDFVVAVVTGLITSEGFLHLLAHDAPNTINMYPLVMFPAFFVPIFLAFHLLSISRLRQLRHTGEETGGPDNLQALS